MASMHASNLYCALTIIQFIFANCQTGNKGPVLAPDERFMDIFPVTRDNFTEIVLLNIDPWIIVFHDGSISKAWKQMAVANRGNAWFGMVDKTKELELLNDIEYNAATDPEGRVYPYGDKKTKLESWKPAKNANDARQMAVDSVPDLTTVMKGKDVESFLVKCFSSTPSKFPLILLTDDTDTAPMFKVVASRFQQYFNFGKFVWPTVEDFRALGIGPEDDAFVLPAILILVPSEPKMVTEISFSAIEYDEKVMGRMNYPNLLHFLFTVNNKYRHWLPGKDMSGHQEIAEMSDILHLESKRFEIWMGGKPYQPESNLNKKPNKTSSSKKSKKKSEPRLSDSTVNQGTGTKDEL